MNKAKSLVPVYGVKTVKDSPLQLEKDIILRNVKLLDKEHEVFKKHGLRSGYDAVLEIDYSFDEDDPNGFGTR